MPQIIFVVNNPARWNFDIPGVQIVSAHSYLTKPEYSSLRNSRIFNLCRSYSYQRMGYYVSLLAEARNHKPIPSISTLQDLKYQSLLRVVSSDLEDLIQKSLGPLTSQEFTLSIYFGRNLAKRYERLSRELYNLFPTPLLRASFHKEGDQWLITNLSPISSKDIPESHRQAVVQFAGEYFKKPGFSTAPKKNNKHSLAILIDPADPTPPSDSKAIERFISAAEHLSISCYTVDKDDYGRIAEYDALFIRQTTAVNNITYRFARRAEAEGMPVIDDPISIVRCTNKVYLAELLQRNEIPAPRTVFIHKDNYQEIPAMLGFPCVLKQPDSAFSLGVVKVDNQESYEQTVIALLDKSEMLIGQEYMVTDYDWRIGILDRKPFYACKYFMARNHWQIYNNAVKGDKGFMGGFKTFPVEIAPSRVVKAALKAANLIGSSLYGVDLKEIDGKPYVIEINDNPSIESGVEDAVLRKGLYERLAESFLRRIEISKET